MDPEILAYLGAALMVVLAFLAYRYWHSTATFARRMRETHAHQFMGPSTRTAPPGVDSPAADLAVEAEDLVGHSPVDFLSEAAEVASNGDPEDADDPGPPSESDRDDLPTGPVAEVQTVEDGPGGEPVEDRHPDNVQPGEDAPLASPATRTDPTGAPSTDTENGMVPGYESDSVTANNVEPETEPIPPRTDSGSGLPIADDRDAGSFEVPEPDSHETEEQDGEPAAETTDDRIVESDEATGNGSMEPDNGQESSNLKPEYRLIEELEPRNRSLDPPPAGSFTQLLKELDEQLAALPSGIELIDLPILERRRIADRREELLSDRELLLEEKKRGAHRRRKRSRTKS